MKLRDYYELARFHKPIGFLLLWCPTAWALWIANEGKPPYQLIFLFFLGTIFMRSAGCIVNDIVDRKFDRLVKRTQNRPLTAGKVTLIEAFMLLFCFLIASLFVLIQLPRICFYYAFMALLVTAIYPFCKRFIQGPQLMLGIAFSISIPMVYAASGLLPDKNMMVLLLINFLWIIAYDTQYAMVDRQDDLQIGIKSTAILFANADCLIIGLLQLFVHLLWLYLALSLSLSIVFYCFWGIGAGILCYQQWLIHHRDETQCLKAFSSNGWYGLLLWLALIFTRN